MKRLFLLLVMLAFITACNKQEVPDLPSVNVHYGLKDYMMVVDLMAGQNIYVGTVTYLDTEDGFFKITYDLVDGWEMSESHAYAGPVDEMPVNKPGAPKIGKFPYKSVHDTWVTTYTYTVAVTDWEKFVCAAHAVVNHPTEGNETAWASGNKTFSDKGWGSYTDNFSTVATHIQVIYGIEQTNDGSLGVVYINISNPVPEVIISEPVITSGSGSVIAAAVDPNSNHLFFVIGNTLYFNDLNTDEPSIVIGTITGTPGGGAFLNGNFYYLDVDPTSGNYNEIIEVQLTFTDGTWTAVINEGYSAPNTTFNNYQITDMAATGNEIYLIGINNNTGNIDLFLYHTDTGLYDSNITSTNLNGVTQIAFGPDGNLWAVNYDDMGQSELVILDPVTGDDDVVDVPGDDSLGDMSDLTIGADDAIIL